MNSVESSSNKNLLFVTALIAGVCLFKLLMAATETGNWHGAWISIAHVVVVAAGCVAALRR